MNIDLKNLGTAYSKLLQEEKFIGLQSIKECEAIGGQILDRKNRAEVMFLGKKVVICSNCNDNEINDFYAHHLKTQNPQLVAYIITRIAKALAGTMFETQPERFRPLIGILLSSASLGISNVEEDNSAEEAKIFVKENLCALFAGLLKNEISFLMSASERMSIKGNH